MNSPSVLSLTDHVSFISDKIKKFTEARATSLNSDIQRIWQKLSRVAHFGNKSINNQKSPDLQINGETRTEMINK